MCVDLSANLCDNKRGQFKYELTGLLGSTLTFRFSTYLYDSFVRCRLVCQLLL